MRPSLRAMPHVVSAHFDEDLSSWRDPTVSREPLGHRRGSGEPAGEVSGIAVIGEPLSAAHTATGSIAGPALDYAVQRESAPSQAPAQAGRMARWPVSSPADVPATTVARSPSEPPSISAPEPAQVDLTESVSDLGPADVPEAPTEQDRPMSTSAVSAASAPGNVATSARVEVPSPPAGPAYDLARSPTGLSVVAREPIDVLPPPVTEPAAAAEAVLAAPERRPFEAGELGAPAAPGLPVVQRTVAAPARPVTTPAVQAGPSISTEPIARADVPAPPPTVTTEVPAAAAVVPAQEPTSTAVPSSAPERPSPLSGTAPAIPTSPPAANTDPVLDLARPDPPVADVQRSTAIVAPAPLLGSPEVSESSGRTDGGDVASALEGAPDQVVAVPAEPPEVAAEPSLDLPTPPEVPIPRGVAEVSPLVGSGEIVTGPEGATAPVAPAEPVTPAAGMTVSPATAAGASPGASDSPPSVPVTPPEAPAEPSLDLPHQAEAPSASLQRNEIGVSAPPAVPSAPEAPAPLLGSPEEATPGGPTDVHASDVPGSVPLDRPDNPVGDTPLDVQRSVTAPLAPAPFATEAPASVPLRSAAVEPPRPSLLRSPVEPLVLRQLQTRPNRMPNVSPVAQSAPTIAATPTPESSPAEPPAASGIPAPPAERALAPAPAAGATLESSEISAPVEPEASAEGANRLGALLGDRPIATVPAAAAPESGEDTPAAPGDAAGELPLQRSPISPAAPRQVRRGLGAPLERVPSSAQPIAAPLEENPAAIAAGLPALPITETIQRLAASQAAAAAPRAELPLAGMARESARPDPNAFSLSSLTARFDAVPVASTAPQSDPDSAPIVSLRPIHPSSDAAAELVESLGADPLPSPSLQLIASDAPPAYDRDVAGDERPAPASFPWQAPRPADQTLPPGPGAPAGDHLSGTRKTPAGFPAAAPSAPGPSVQRAEAGASVPPPAAPTRVVVPDYLDPSGDGTVAASASAATGDGQRDATPLGSPVQPRPAASPPSVAPAAAPEGSASAFGVVQRTATGSSSPSLTTASQPSAQSPFVGSPASGSTTPVSASLPVASLQPTGSSDRSFAAAPSVLPLAYSAAATQVEVQRQVAASTPSAAATPTVIERHAEPLVVQRSMAEPSVQRFGFLADMAMGFIAHRNQRTNAAEEREKEKEKELKEAEEARKLAARIYPMISQKLKAELGRDRERAGMITGLHR